MAIARAKTVLWKPAGLSDALDASFAFPGAMASLANLVPSVTTAGLWETRPGIVQIGQVTSVLPNATALTALFCFGRYVYGMASDSGTGTDKPFVYDLILGTFGSAANITASNTPTTLSFGSSQPCIMDVVGSRVIVTHQGFAGAASGDYFGWLDFSGFSSNTITGNTHSGTKVIDTLSANPLTSGWQVGYAVAGTNIPANTYIVSMTATSITVNNASTGSTAGVTLTVTGGTTLAPLWGSGNTNGNGLAAVPLAVANFNGRAWYAVPAISSAPPAIVFSDSLNATQVTNASQALTMSNNLNVTAFGKMGLSSPINGGIVQSLIAFQGTSAMQQITGDAATSNLALNNMNVATGTSSPLSVVNCPAGLAFISEEGLRFVEPSGTVTGPVGLHGEGIAQPFINPGISLTAVSGAFSQNTLRFVDQINSPTFDYCYDMGLKAWHGSHSTGAEIICPSVLNNNSFLISRAGSTIFYSSDVVPTSGSVYTERGANISSTYGTCLMPMIEDMKMGSLIESLLWFNCPTTTTITATLYDEAGSSLGSYTYSNPTTPAGLRAQLVPFPTPIVYGQMSLTVSLAGNGHKIQIGAFRHRSEALDYTLQNTAV